MNKIYTSILAAAATAIVATAVIAPASVNAWSDSANGRPSYTIAEINAGKLGDTITFNSISNGNIGNEKNFVGARVASNTSGNWEGDTINVKDGETYTIRIYAHNNSPKGTAKIAEGVKATFSIPSGVSKSHTIIGYLDSSNATPNRYWDEVALTSSDEFYLEYVSGSAAFTNGKLGTVKLPDSIISTGATLGYDKLDGKIPGCFEYTGTATIQVKVHKAVSSKLSKVVRLKGATDWSESVAAKVGDEVEYQIEYKNLLSNPVDNVIIRDFLPENMEYVKNSTYLFNAKFPSGAKLDQNTVATTGVNIGGYAAGANAFVRFTAKVVDKSLKCGDNQLINWANSTVNNAVSRDDASVMVKKTGGTCDTPTPPAPPTPPEPTPQVIPSTGPSAIVLGALGVGATVTTAGYYVASRKKLMKK
ncbi:DUF11 domain-containing protein [Candidatus Saccharibacteria bacterium]|nr:DUF11 domain-containing protein [Candidatus Saccharibacteria bacterium]